MEKTHITEVHVREQMVIILNQLYEKGYRYVVRDKEALYLSCYSLKPKKYRDMESWGYKNPQAQGAAMAYPIRNTDIKEINWTNRSAMPISDFINKGLSYE